MKFLLLALLLAMALTTQQASAETFSFGDKIGNGGGLWACVKRNKIVKSQLVDLFEAEREQLLKIPVPKQKDPMAIYEAKKKWIAKNLPNLYPRFRDSFDYVERNLKIVRAKLEPIDDRGLFRSKPLPSECLGGQWKYTQFANSNDDGEVMVQSDLWLSKAVTPNDKAALLVHEAIYRWLRIYRGDTDSLHTRKITGLLFSDLDPATMHAYINRVANISADPWPAAPVDDSAGFFIKSTNDFGATFAHKADAPYGSDVGTTNFSSPCRIPNGATGKEADIFCIFEAEELDAYFSPLQLQVHVPSNACSFLRSKPYYFYSYEPGEGPAKAVHEITEDGSIRDVLNTKNGEPTCPYNYLENGGPNCCTGTYDHTITVYSSDGPSSVTVHSSWNGRASACVAGAATTFSGSKLDNDGYPAPILENIAGTGKNSEYTFWAPGSVTQFGKTPYSNLFNANFYNPSDHAGGKPAGLKGKAGIRNPQDTYTWECLDSSGTPKARIRLMVREWNTHPIQEGGNPDADGADETEDEFPPVNLNDLFDWKDFGNAFPGVRL